MPGGRQPEYADELPTPEGERILRRLGFIEIGRTTPYVPAKAYLPPPRRPRAGGGILLGVPPLAYDDLGTGPAVLLLHAGVADRRMWAEHLPALAAAGFRAVATDLPGFGDSPAAQREDAPWRDVLATLDALGIERAALVGNSFGGLVAQRVVVLAPSRVSALALFSSPVSSLPPSPQLAAAWEEEERALERGDIEEAVRAVLATWLLPGAPPQLRERVASMQRCAFELQSAAPAAPEGADPLAEGLAALAPVSVPALIAVGEHDMDDFHRAAAALADALPMARQAVIAGAGHLPPLERPREFRALLLAFLKDAQATSSEPGTPA